MTDIPPPPHIKYCSLCMSRHNAGFVVGVNYNEEGRCHGCGRVLDEE